MKTTTLLVVAELAMLLTACSSQPKGFSSASSVAKDKIIGKWQTTTGGTMQFHPGGGLTMAGPKDAVDVTYTFPSDNTLEIKKSRAAAGIRYQVEFPSPNEAMLIEGDGQRMMLKRVQ